MYSKKVTSNGALNQLYTRVEICGAYIKKFAHRYLYGYDLLRLIFTLVEIKSALPYELSWF